MGNARELGFDLLEMKFHNCTKSISVNHMPNIRLNEWSFEYQSWKPKIALPIS